MRAGNPVHDLSPADDHSKRHTGSNALGAANDVGMHAGVLDRPPLTGAGDSALHFVHHQQDAVLVADAAQFLHEVVWSNDVAAFALDWLHKDCSHFFGGKRGLEQLVFNEASAAERELLCVLRTTFAPAIYIGITNVRDAWDERRETALLLRLRSRQ